MKHLLLFIVFLAATMSCNKKSAKDESALQFVECYKNAPVPAPEFRKPPPPPLPQVFVNLSGTPTTVPQVVLNWTIPISGSVTYRIHRSSVSGFTPSLSTRIGITSSMSYTDNYVQFGLTYYYRITGCKSNGSEFAVSEQIAVAVGNAPGGQKTVFLNFGDAVISDPDWTPYNNNQPINCVAANLTVEAKQEIFDSVKAKVHRAMIEENLDPALLLLTTTEADFNNADPHNRAQIMITETIIYEAGGIAFVGSFYKPGTKTCFVFPGNLYWNTRYIFESAAHELGHMFGLWHHVVCENGVVVLSWIGMDMNTGEGHVMGQNYTPSGTSRYREGVKNGCGGINDTDSIKACIIR